jgi:hypothetical protein
MCWFIPLSYKCNMEDSSSSATNPPPRRYVEATTSEQCPKSFCDIHLLRLAACGELPVHIDLSTFTGVRVQVAAPSLARSHPRRVAVVATASGHKSGYIDSWKQFYSLNASQWDYRITLINAHIPLTSPIILVWWEQAYKNRVTYTSTHTWETKHLCIS